MNEDETLEDLGGERHDRLESGERWEKMKTFTLEGCVGKTGIGKCSRSHPREERDPLPGNPPAVSLLSLPLEC